MALPSKKTLEKYLVQLRRIEEHREVTANSNIIYHYKQLKKDLQEFLGVEYAKYAQDDSLTVAILQEKAQYARFLEEVEKRINDITPKVATEIRSAVKDTYKIAYDGIVDNVKKSNDKKQLHANLKGIRAVTPEVIKNVVDNSYMEDALKRNHKAFIYDIRQQIGIGLTQGDRMSTMAKRMSEQIDKDYRKSMLITRTEVHRVREAGHNDASVDIDNILKDGESDYRMVKIWRNMGDESVRPQVRRKTKKGWKTYKAKLGAPNHVKMEGQTVLADEEFDLGGGVKAKSPGQSGVAGHDCNCRCFVEYELMTDAEYYKATGKHFPETSKMDISPKFTKEEHEALAEVNVTPDKFKNIKLYGDSGTSAYDYLTRADVKKSLDETWEKLQKQKATGKLGATNQKKYDNFEKFMNEVNGIDSSSVTPIKHEVLKPKHKIEKTIKNETKHVTKESTKLNKTSKVTTSTIKSKKLDNSIHDAFDAVKNMNNLATDVDSVITEVKYAIGRMEEKMNANDIGAIALGKAIYVNKSVQKYIDKDFMIHEIGHKVTKYGEKMTDATAKRVVDEIIKELNSPGIKNYKDLASWVSDFAYKSKEVEIFPEAFMIYASGKELTGTRKKVIDIIMKKMYFK